MFGGCAELDNGTFSSTHKEKKKKGIMKKSDITLFLEDAWQAWIPWCCSIRLLIWMTFQKIKSGAQKNSCQSKPQPLKTMWTWMSVNQTYFNGFQRGWSKQWTLLMDLHFQTYSFISYRPHLRKGTPGLGAWGISLNMFVSDQSAVAALGLQLHQQS